jgi:beta-glucosidase
VLALQEVAIVVIGQTSHEGADRSTLSLDQSDLVAAVAAAQRNTIVVAISPGPFLTPWRASVAAIVDFGFPGEQAGGAVADVLFGDVNPAGKSPHTMPNKENEMEMTPRQYPGVGPPDTDSDDDAAVTSGGEIAPCANPVPTDSATGLNPQGGTGGSDCVPTKAYYDERLLVGYRWYDQHEVTPAFPFGAKRKRLCCAVSL